MGIPGKVMYLEDSDLENVNLILQNSQEMVRFQTSRDRLDSKPKSDIGVVRRKKMSEEQVQNNLGYSDTSVFQNRFSNLRLQFPDQEFFGFFTEVDNAQTLFVFSTNKAEINSQKQLFDLNFFENYTNTFVSLTKFFFSFHLRSKNTLKSFDTQCKQILLKMSHSLDLFLLKKLYKIFWLRSIKISVSLYQIKNDSDLSQEKNFIFKKSLGPVFPGSFLEKDFWAKFREEWGRIYVYSARTVLMQERFNLVDFIYGEAKFVFSQDRDELLFANLGNTRNFPKFQIWVSHQEESVTVSKKAIVKGKAGVDVDGKGKHNSERQLSIESGINTRPIGLRDVLRRGNLVSKIQGALVLLKNRKKTRVNFPDLGFDLEVHAGPVFKSPWGYTLSFRNENLQEPEVYKEELTQRIKTWILNKGKLPENKVMYDEKQRYSDASSVRSLDSSKRRIHPGRDRFFYGGRSDPSLPISNKRSFLIHRRSSLITYPNDLYRNTTISSNMKNLEDISKNEDLQKSIVMEFIPPGVSSMKEPRNTILGQESTFKFRNSRRMMFLNESYRNVGESTKSRFNEESQRENIFTRQYGSAQLDSREHGFGFASRIKDTQRSVRMDDNDSRDAEDLEGKTRGQALTFQKGVLPNLGVGVDIDDSETEKRKSEPQENLTDIRENDILSPKMTQTNLSTQLTDRDTNQKEKEPTAPNSGFFDDTPQKEINERFKNFQISSDPNSQRVRFDDLSPILLDPGVPLTGLLQSEGDNVKNLNPESIPKNENAETLDLIFESKKHKESLFETAKYQGSMNELNHGNDEQSDNLAKKRASLSPESKTSEQYENKNLDTKRDNQHDSDFNDIKTEEMPNLNEEFSSEDSQIEGGMQLRPSKQEKDLEEELTDIVYPLSGTMISKERLQSSRTDQGLMGKENLNSENQETSISPTPDQFVEMTDNRKKIFVLNTISDKSKLDQFSSKNSLNPMSPLLEPPEQIDQDIENGKSSEKVPQVKVINEFKEDSERGFGQVDSPLPVKKNLISPKFVDVAGKKDVFNFQKITQNERKSSDPMPTFIPNKNLLAPPKNEISFHDEKSFQNDDQLRSVCEIKICPFGLRLSAEDVKRQELFLKNRAGPPAIDFGRKTMEMIEESVKLARKDNIEICEEVKGDIEDVRKSKDQDGVMRKIFRLFRYRMSAGEMNWREKEKTLSQKVNDWNYDVLSETPEYLHLILRKIFCPYLDKFEIPLSTFYNFTRRAEYYYSRGGNPFHNFYHGVAVAHSGRFMMKNVFGFDEILDDHLRLAFLLGCFGHDLDHTGRNNAFEVQSGSKLAVRYHEDSPLENHHAATLFKIIGNLSGVKGKKCDGGYYGSRMECDLLKGFSAEERGRMKNFVIQVILATDMKIHFKLIDLMGMVEKDEEIENEEVEETDKEIELEEQTLIASIIIHAADISGAAKTETLEMKWARRVTTEFIAQREAEEALNLKPTLHFNNLEDEHTFQKSQVSFIKFIVKPLFCHVIDFARWNLERKLRKEAKSRPEIEEYYTQEGVLERIRRLENQEQWEIPVSGGELEGSIMEIKVEGTDSSLAGKVDFENEEGMRVQIEKSDGMDRDSNESLRRVVPGLSKNDICVIGRVDALMSIVSTLKDNYVRHMKKAELLKKSD